MKTVLTSFQRFHSLLMVRLKTRSCSKLLAVQKRVSRAMVGETTLTFFQEIRGDGTFLWRLSYWLRTLSYRAVILQPAPLFLPRRECFAVLFSWFLFYLHVAAPALCQSWQSRLKWARPFSRIPANHGAPLGLLRLSWPIRTPWRITDRLRVRVTDGRTISFKI